jgi:peptidoglycan/xylan/chitin deacetylase (PgdA/CDA1 family)
MKKNNFISISLHLDSLGESYGWPDNYVNDNAFSAGLERVGKFLKKFEIPITVFVVGKDLENKKNLDLLKKFINDNDVEIANHSYNHQFDLGSKSYEEIYKDIYLSHEIIYKKLKVEAKGFCSPTWNFSQNIVKVLDKLNYNYDTSNFNSLWLYPVIAKILFNHLTNFDLKKSFKILKRKDYLLMLSHNQNPYFLQKNSKVKGKILEIPMSSISKFDLPIWHTIGFIFGLDYLVSKVKKYLEKNPFLNYVIHPADFLVKSDLDKRYVNSLNRINNNQIKDKLLNFEKILEIAIQNRFNFIKVNDYFNNCVK